MMESSSRPDVRRTTTKMASMTAVSVFLLCCFAVASVASQDCDQFAATGRSFNVSLGRKWDSNANLKWKFKDAIIFYKRQGTVITGKIEDINTDGSFKLTNVRKDQEGLYSTEVYDQSGKGQPTKSIKLCVLDPVKKPKVEATCEDKNVIIKCIPDKQPKDVEYEWLKNGVKMEKEKRLSFQVKAADTKADKFACSVSNKASFEVSEAVAHNCAKTDCDQFAATGRSFSVSVGYTLSDADTFKWMFNDKTIFHKNQTVVITGEINDVNADGSLKLTNVRKDQSGVYSAEVVDEGGIAEPIKSIHLCILDPVKKPKVNTTCEGENVTITCIPGQKLSDLGYKWFQNGVEMEKEKRLSFQVKAEDTKADNFACKVFNNASSEVSEAVAHNCAKTDCDQFAATGRSFTVSLGYTLKKTDTLRWKFNDTIIFYTKPSGVIKGKKDDINADGSLKLTNVRKNQSGLYSAEVFDQSGREQTRRTIKLCVLDPVKKPKVEATCEDKNVIITCIPGQQPKDVEYRWLKNGVEMKKETKLSFEVKAAETKADKFACKFSNKASSEVSDAVAHNCTKTAIPGLPDELWGIPIWYILGGGGGIVLLLIIIVIVCCVQTRRTRKLRLKDEEELRLEWTNTEQHHHHHHHLPPLPNHPPPHHPHNQQQQQQQQQAPGNTGPRQSRSKQNRQPRPKAPEPNSQPQPSPRRALQAQKHANDADEEQPPPLPQPRKKGPKTQVD
ncbi:uncharacterized protein V3H82_023895 isoform 3-T3 [Fundulus diaphanus]